MMGWQPQEEEEEEEGAHRAEDHVQRHGDVQVQGVVIDHTDGEEHGHHDEIVPETWKNTWEMSRNLPEMLREPSGMIVGCTERAGAQGSVTNKNGEMQSEFGSFSRKTLPSHSHHNKSLR